MSLSPYSSVIPNLQTAWDSTSFRSLMQCPQQYKYGIVDGWRLPEGRVDLEFGGYFASAAERYKKARLRGLDKLAATVEAVRYVIEATWLPGEAGSAGAPWGGRYETFWHCTGTEPYKNAKGNKAKCPFSHKGVWFPEPAPDVCGECGSMVATERQWVSNNKAKDRYTLVRLVAAYCDAQPETAEEGAYPYAFPSGLPAVELSFQMPLPWRTPVFDRSNPGVETRLEGGEPYILCGHLDSIMQFGTEYFGADNKTTKNALNANYFAGFSPDIQVDIYDLAGSTLYSELNLRGFMIEGAQTTQSAAKFAVGLQYRSDGQREELLADLRYWLTQAEKFAIEGHWPRNRASCKMCQFKMVCSKEPQMREQYLEANYVRQPWNPLAER